MQVENVMIEQLSPSSHYFVEARLASEINNRIMHTSI